MTAIAIGARVRTETTQGWVYGTVEGTYQTPTQTGYVLRLDKEHTGYLGGNPETGAPGPCPFITKIVVSPRNLEVCGPATPCGRPHGAYHDDACMWPIVCTLPLGHAGGHVDHSGEANGEVIEFT